MKIVAKGEILEGGRGVESFMRQVLEGEKVEIGKICARKRRASGPFLGQLKMGKKIG